MSTIYADGSVSGQEYLIEAMSLSGSMAGRWYILGSDRLSSGAQRWMRQYRQQMPGTPIRIQEYPSRRLIMMEGSPEVLPA